MIAEQTKNSTGTQRTSQKGSIPPEAELLLCCVRHQFNTATSAEIADLLRKDLDWDYLIQKAAKHNVFLLLYQTLKNTHPELIEPSIYEQLQERTQKIICFNLFLTKELFQVLEYLAAHDIQAIPFKGPIWATLAYGNMALREFCDLDILVRPEDYIKAKELLIKQGYYDKYFGTKEWEEKKQVKMVRHDGKVKIDLHLELASKQFYLRLDLESFFEGLQTLSIGGRTVTTFSPENTLALGYIQGTKDSWESLKRICDLAALIRTYPDVNWQNIVARCVSNDSDRNFWLGTIVTQSYLQIASPEDLVEKSKQFPELSEIAAQHKQLFYRGEFSGRHLFGGLKLFSMVDMSLWGKVRYSVGIVLNVNERDRETFALPSFLFFLYYPLRIIRLIKTYKIGKEKIAFIWELLRR